MLKSLLLSAGSFLLAMAVQAQPTPEIILPGQLLATTGAETAARASSIVWQPQQSLTQGYSAGAWVDVSRNNYLRYPVATPTLPGRVMTERKSGTVWSAYAQHRYRYTSAGQIQTDTVDQFTSAPYGAYFVYSITFITPSQPQYEWQMNHTPGSPAPWDTTKRNTHSYNTAGQRIQTLEQFYSNRRFSTAARRLWTYNSLGQVSVYETQSPNSSTAGTWNNLQRFTYTYNAAGKVQQVISESAAITTGIYSNAARNTYQFDAQGRESILTSESWTNGAWVRSSQTLYTYDPNSNLSIATLQAWNATTSAYQNYQRLLFTYVGVLNTQAGTFATQLQLAPNPAVSGQATTLHYQLLGTSTVSLAVFDVMGRVVAAVPPATQAAGSHTMPVPVQLASGLYTVRLTAGKQHQAIKLVVD